LLAGISARDGDACAVFYRRHVARTVAFLLRETRDPELAADLTAEVFAAVIVAASRYRPQGDSAGPWVIGIARNTLGASRRRNRVEDRARRQLAMEAIELDDSDVAHTEAMAETGGVVQLLPNYPPTNGTRFRRGSCGSAATATSQPNWTARRWSCASGSAEAWGICVGDWRDADGRLL